MPILRGMRRRCLIYSRYLGCVLEAAMASRDSGQEAEDTILDDVKDVIRNIGNSHQKA